MSSRADDHRLPDIAPDDPRLSEWIDGRLSGPEAAAVGRAVAASPELTRLVADLRGLKATLGGLPATPPDTGFVGTTLAAIAAAPAADDERAEDRRDDLRVDAEWHKVEEERIALERAEASADAGEAPRPPQRWRWLPMVGALAAGLLVAAVLNVGRVPGVRGDRTVALAPRPDEAESRPAGAVTPPGAAAPAEEGGRATAGAEQALAPAGIAAEKNRLQAGAEARALEPMLAPAEPGRGAAVATAKADAPADDAIGFAAAAARAGSAGPSAPGAPAVPSAPGAPPSAAAVPAAGADAGPAPARQVLVVRVAGSAARERLQALIRERGATSLPVAPPAPEPILTDPGTVLAETGRIASQDTGGKQADLGPAGEFDFLEISGPAPAIEALVAAFSGAAGPDRAADATRSGAARALTSDTATEAPAGTGGDRARREREIAAGTAGTARLLIRVVDVEATAAKGAEAAAGASP